MVRLYNSLTRKLEEFIPRTDKKVQMFACGPTVYDRIHLGNARSFTAFDTVAKWLRYRGYEVDYLQNITDVDDKIIVRAAQQGQEPTDYARKYDSLFRSDMTALGNDAVTRYAPATDHIPQVLSQVKRLRDTGHAYLIEGDGWYFDLSTFADYGKLSGRTALEAEDSVSRIDDSSKKRNAGDFALWKLSKPGEPVWEDSELGAGRPGWHIEDTAITEHYFGPQYDLHGGGMDLKFPHHEAEIAQQEAASGKVPFVKYWMHAGFLTTSSEKMSKSKGNFITLAEALERWSAPAIRFYLLSGHYREPLELTDRSLDGATAAVQRIAELAAKLHAIAPTSADDSALLAAVHEATHAVEESMDNDFNTAAAFGAVFTLVTAANAALAAGQVGTESRDALLGFLAFIGEQFGIVTETTASIPDDIQKLVDQREAARSGKDFTTSDKLRDQLAELGYTVDDTPYGPLVKRK